MEETFKVLNGAYKIITGSKPEPTSAEMPEARDKDLDSKRSFEEVLENVSNEVAHLENEIRKSTSRPASRPASRPTSKMSTSSRLVSIQIKIWNNLHTIMQSVRR